MKTMTIGNYTVTEHFEEKRFFIPIIEDGKKKSIPIRRVKRTIALRHVKGGMVVFTIYNHGGMIRYRDSRYKQSFVNSDHHKAEVKRMLEVDDALADNLIRLAA